VTIDYNRATMQFQKYVKCNSLYIYIHHSDFICGVPKFHCYYR